MLLQQDVNVSAESLIVSQVPSGVVRIFIDVNRIGIPIPVPNISILERCYAEKVVADREALRAASTQMKNMAGAESQREPAARGMIQVEAGVVASRIMPYPVPVVMDVRSFGMPGRVAEPAIVLLLLLLAPILRLLLWHLLLLRLLAPILRLLLWRLLLWHLLLLRLLAPLLLLRLWRLLLLVWRLGSRRWPMLRRSMLLLMLPRAHGRCDRGHAPEHRTG